MKSERWWVVFLPTGELGMVARITRHRLGAIMFFTDIWEDVEAEEKWRELEAEGWTVREVTLQWEDDDE